jgi:Ca-activated chloride channel family protein
MRWEWPWFLLLLLALPVLWARMRRPGQRPAAVLWGTLPERRARAGNLVLSCVGFLPWLALTLALLAIARPQLGIRQSETETRGVDISIALDVSPSMRTPDFLPSNRLTVAKQTARDFIRQRPHDRIALVGFAGTAFTQCPLTLDHDALLELLQGLDFNLAEEGTAIGMGLATAVSGLKDSRSPSKVVVLLTDGENNRGAIDPITGADLAKALGVKVYTVLVGRKTVVQVPVDDPDLGPRLETHVMDVGEETLRELASRTGGKFFRARDPAALVGIYSQIDRLERAPLKSIEYREYNDLGPMLLGWAALALALFTLSGATWGFRLP